MEQNYKVKSSLLLEKKEMELREVIKWLYQGHTANKFQS